MAVSVSLKDNVFLGEDEIKEYVFDDVDNRTDEEIDVVYRIANGVCEAIKRYLDKPIINEEVTERRDGGDGVIFLSNYPVISISSVTDDGDTLDDPSSEGAGDGGYDYIADIGELYKEQGVFTTGRQKVEVTYTAGYGSTEADIPFDLKQAALIWIAQMWDVDVENYATIITEGEVVRPSRMPRQSTQLLQPYVKVNVR